MERFVFEADIIVPQLELHRQRYEIDFDTMRQLLTDLDHETNELGIDVLELKQLLNDEGQISTFVRTQGGHHTIRQLIAALAKSAWLNELPWTLDQAEGFGVGDEKFHECIRAYIMPDDDHPLGYGANEAVGESNVRQA